MSSIVRMSKFTPNLTNGKGVGLDIGDRVLYITKEKKPIHCIIDSRFSVNFENVCGYEAIDDNNERIFLDENRIIDWKEKDIIQNDPDYNKTTITSIYTIELLEQILKLIKKKTEEIK